MWRCTASSRIGPVSGKGDDAGGWGRGTARIEGVGVLADEHGRVVSLVVR